MFPMPYDFQSTEPLLALKVFHVNQRNILIEEFYKLTSSTLHWPFCVIIFLAFCKKMTFVLSNKNTVSLAVDEQNTKHHIFIILNFVRLIQVCFHSFKALLPEVTEEMLMSIIRQSM